MKLQYLCHTRWFVIGTLFGFTGVCAADNAMQAGPQDHDYPTIARVEYVNQCVADNGAKLAALYQCACAIDKIAAALSYDDFVEATTYAKYVSLPGPGGSLFRDADHSRGLAKKFHELESDALRDCGRSG